ncbi:MAG: hypothetical protein FJ295_21455 [Planctomycetes bacterium]|nr:hypothetical protein [Planctomycetota bacterium]
MRPLHAIPVRRATLLLATLAAIYCGGTGEAYGQRRTAHYFQSADLPPGTVGQAQLLRGGPLPGYFQPVEVRCPQGCLISAAVGPKYTEPQSDKLLAGMLVGSVYRLKISKIPLNETDEVYPTIEVINRLHPPPGQEARFPIPIEITEEELRLAIRGQFVTRVIYLEDPQRPFPLREDPQNQRVFEVHPADDPLRVADELGRPMAILRMGSRVPDEAHDPTQLGFGYGSPPLKLLATPVDLPRDAGLETDSSPPGTRAAVRYPRLPLIMQPGAPMQTRRPQGAAR